MVLSFVNTLRWSARRPGNRSGLTLGGIRRPFGDPWRDRRGPSSLFGPSPRRTSAGHQVASITRQEGHAMRPTPVIVERGSSARGLSGAVPGSTPAGFGLRVGWSSAQQRPASRRRPSVPLPFRPGPVAVELPSGRVRCRCGPVSQPGSAALTACGAARAVPPGQVGLTSHSVSFRVQGPPLVYHRTRSTARRPWNSRGAETRSGRRASAPRPHDR